MFYSSSIVASNHQINEFKGPPTPCYACGHRRQLVIHTANLLSSSNAVRSTVDLRRTSLSSDGNDALNSFFFYVQLSKRPSRGIHG